MVDFNDNSRQYKGKVYPIHAYETSGLFKRTEAILTPEKFISRFLLGVPMPEQFRNTEVIQDRIHTAINDVELELKSTVYPEQFVQKVPYDASKYNNFIFTKVEHKPVLSLQSLQIVGANGEVFYEIPAQWIEMANAMSGQINVLPLLSTFGFQPTAGATQTSGLVFLNALGNLPWLPAFWEVKYVSGLSLESGQIPVVVNNLIGCFAAIDILSNLASLNTKNSVSMGQDGISQSSSGPGPQVYTTRIQELEAKKQKYLNEIKALYGNKYFISNI